MPCTCYAAKQQISRAACNTLNEMLRMLRNRPASCSLSRSVACSMLTVQGGNTPVATVQNSPEASAVSLSSLSSRKRGAQDGGEVEPDRGVHQAVAQLRVHLAGVDGAAEGLGSTCTHIRHAERACR